jgi:acyl-coenzyme A thioesterase PaaI-like protein
VSSPGRIDPPARLFQPGHAAGDFLGAPRWDVISQSPGFLRLGVDLPEHVLNPRGQLFGGFTGTYVDLVALATAHAGPSEERVWLATTSMRIEYLAPLVGLLKASRGRTRVIDVTFLGDDDEEPAVLATATMRQLPDPSRPGERVTK